VSAVQSNVLSFDGYSLYHDLLYWKMHSVQSTKTYRDWTICSWTKKMQLLWNFCRFWWYFMSML